MAKDNVQVDLTAYLWIQVGDSSAMYKVGELTFEELTLTTETDERIIAEMRDALAKAVPHIQPLLRRDVSITHEENPENLDA